MAGAPEWRFDPLTGRRVLISPDRADRPRRIGPICPFCEGHESETPPEVLAYRDHGSAPNGPGWRVRVVPNRYAAVRLDAGAPWTPPAPAIGPVPTPGLGVAEVILESPDHETHFCEVPHSLVIEVVTAWRERLRHWRTDGRLAFAQVFKNEGAGAGASVEHCHSQLIGIFFVPPAVAAEIERVGRGPCAYCRWLGTTRDGPCAVVESDLFIAVCPPAPRFPGETWVLPLAHASSFEDIEDPELNDLAVVLQDLLVRIRRAFSDPDYNLIIRSAPFRHDETWHWRIELLPRTTTPAGWEWGTGELINTMFPDQAAALLRAAG
jgi:UDPglucose--hexose-1-phosphate uridylyltransferase